MHCNGVNACSCSNDDNYTMMTMMDDNDDDERRRSNGRRARRMWRRSVTRARQSRCNTGRDSGLRLINTHSTYSFELCEQSAFFFFFFYKRSAFKPSPIPGAFTVFTNLSTLITAPIQGVMFYNTGCSLLLFFVWKNKRNAANILGVWIIFRKQILFLRISSYQL